MRSPLPAPAERYVIGPFVLDGRTEALLKGREPMPVGRRAVAVLKRLVANVGDVVTKDELMHAGWGGLAVEESNLAVQIAALRRLFTAESEGGNWIETLPRRGYRFVGPVCGGIAEAPPGLPAAEPADASLHPRRHGRPSLAVLPFRTPEPDPVPLHVADGFAEALVSSLSGLADLTVISFGTSSRFRGAEMELPRIARELDVRYVASGSIRQSGERSRIIAELADAPSSVVLTSRSYDLDRTAPFETQDRVVAQIVQTLAPKVREEELRRVRAKRPESLVAYDLVLQARAQIYRLDRESFDRSEALLTRAIALDPYYAAAHALMAEFHSLRYGQGWSTDSAADGRAVAKYAQQAIECDPTDARALAFLAHNKAFIHRDYDAALPLFERALDVGPSNAGAWMWSSVTFSFIGDGEEAVRRARLALRLSPRDWFGFQFNTALCLAHYVSGAYEEAVRFGRSALAEGPRYHSALRYMIASLAAQSDFAQAKALAREMMSLEPGFRLAPLLASHPFRDAAQRERYANHLRAAGLPD